MRLRARVKLISYISASVLVIFGAGIVGFNMAENYRTRTQYSYQRSLSQLSDYCSSIKTTLEKSSYANTPPQQYGLASKLMVEAEGAKNALSQLPVSQNDGEGIQKYLTQVGDFASFSIGKLSRNETLSKDNKSALKKLSEYADNIAPKIEELSAKFGDGEENIGNAVALKSNFGSDTEPNQKSSFDNSFLTVSKSFVDYPSLIYDGPFADSVQQKKPKFTENSKECSAQQAQKILADFVNRDYREITYREKRKGVLPVYVFDGDNLYGTVTVKGGYVCEVYNTDYPSDDSKIKYKETLQKAEDFLKRQKVYDMKDSYYVIHNSVCTINFAYSQNDIICYGDLIKVGVSTVTGDVVSYNAEGYIMNHTERNTENNLISEQKARESVSSELDIISSQKALIPMQNGKEVLCYEFKCKGKDNENVLVYINARTAMEEQIYILLQSDGGTLVM